MIWWNLMCKGVVISFALNKRTALVGEGANLLGHTLERFIVHRDGDADYCEQAFLLLS